MLWGKICSVGFCSSVSKVRFFIGHHREVTWRFRGGSLKVQWDGKIVWILPTFVELSSGNSISTWNLTLNFLRFSPTNPQLRTCHLWQWLHNTLRVPIAGPTPQSWRSRFCAPESGTSTDATCSSPKKSGPTVQGNVHPQTFTVRKCLDERDPKKDKSDFSPKQQNPFILRKERKLDCSNFRSNPRKMGGKPITYQNGLRRRPPETKPKVQVDGVVDLSMFRTPVNLHGLSFWIYWMQFVCVFFLWPGW